MNPEIKARWLAALMSGEYRQGKGTLRTPDDKYCCLGVLCELAVADGVIERRGATYGVFRGEDDGTIFSRVQNDTSETELPEAVSAWAGLAGNSIGEFGRPICVCTPEALALTGDICECTGPSDLASANDDTYIGFAGIADLIEEHL